MNDEIIEHYLSKLDQLEFKIKRHVQNNNEVHIELEDSSQLIEFCNVLKLEINLRLLTMI